MSEFELGVLIFSVGGCFGIAFTYILQAVFRKMEGVTVTYTANIVGCDGKLRGSVVATYTTEVDPADVHEQFGKRMRGDERPVNFRRV